jgi:geranylgeranyl pyrophosphate synthase
MSKPPAVLFKVEPYMHRDIAEEFGLPEGNKEMAERLQEYMDRGGKYLRPGITYAAIEAYKPERIGEFLFPALSLNYDHNFFLIHDDIEDRSSLRRGKPTMHLLYGEDYAINYGDYLRTIAELALDRSLEISGKKTHRRLVLARHEMLKTTCEGQDLDMMLRDRPLSDVTENMVFEMYEKKSGFYTVWNPYRYGAIIAGLPDSKINRLKEPLLHVGEAFQIQDDVLDLTMEYADQDGSATLKEQRFGKDWAGDLEELKRTLPMARLVQQSSSDPHDRDYVRSMLDFNGRVVRLASRRYGLKRKGVGLTDARYVKLQKEIEGIKYTVLDMMHKYNVIESSKDTMTALCKDAVGDIEDALPESEGKKDLLELFHYAVGRGF